MIASDLMQTEFPTVGPDTLLAEAFRIMREADLHALPVVEDDNRLVGLLTEEDLLRAALPVVAEAIDDLGFLPRAYCFHGFDRDHLQAAAVRELTCRRELISVAAEERVAEVAHVMLENCLPAVPVVQDGRVVGLATRTQLVAHIWDAGFQEVTP